MLRRKCGTGTCLSSSMACPKPIQLPLIPASQSFVSGQAPERKKRMSPRIMEHLQQIYRLQEQCLSQTLCTSNSLIIPEWQSDHPVNSTTQTSRASHVAMLPRAFRNAPSYMANNTSPRTHAYSAGNSCTGNTSTIPISPAKAGLEIVGK